MNAKRVMKSAKLIAACPRFILLYGLGLGVLRANQNTTPAASKYNPATTTRKHVPFGVPGIGCLMTHNVRMPTITVMMNNSAEVFIPYLPQSSWHYTIVFPNYQSLMRNPSHYPHHTHRLCERSVAIQRFIKIRSRLLRLRARKDGGVIWVFG